jgi:O-methyltransferase
MEVPLINLEVNSDFLNEDRFTDAYLAGYSTLQALGEHGKEFQYDAWRLRVALWAGEQAARLPGDFVECGVNTGFLSRAIAQYVGFHKRADKRFFLIDTFRGVPPDQFSADELEEGLDARARRLYPDDMYDVCKRNFEFFDNVVVVRGRVPEALAALPIERVAYLSIDMNCAAPEVAAVRHFWDKLVPGGIILFDDYGARGHHHQKEAVDAVARELNNPLLPLPSGQAMLIKQVS